MEKVLIIGGGSFLGAHLTRQLLAAGKAVRVFGRRDYPALRAWGAEAVRGDVTDAGAVQAAVAGMDAVCHLAAKVGISGRAAEYRAVNVGGVRNVVAACLAAGVGRLLYTSTPSVVFRRGDIAGGDETLPYADKFLTAYAATKAEAERLVLAANGPRLATCALRPHLIWGPGDANLIPRIARKARAGRLFQVGDGRNLVSVSYVENVADAHAAALARLAPGAACAGKAYFVNEPEPVNCWEFVGRVLEVLGLPPIRRRLPWEIAYAAGAVLETAGRWLRPGWEPPVTRFLALQLSRSHWFRPDAAMRDLGWAPKVDIDEGLRRLAADFAGKLW